MTFNLYPSLALAKTGARWLTMLVLCGLRLSFTDGARSHGHRIRQGNNRHSVQADIVEYCPLPSASTDAFHWRFQYCRDL